MPNNPATPHRRGLGRRGPVPGRNGLVPDRRDRRAIRRSGAVAGSQRRLSTGPLRGRLWILWVVVLGVVALWAVTGGRLAPFDPYAQVPAARLLPPLARTADGTHLLGTDALGRDLFSQIVVAARLTLFIGTAATVIGLVIGAVVGVCAGYFGGWSDRVLMRLTEAQTALPMFLFAILLMAVAGASVTNLVILLPTFIWPTVARVIRAETLRLRAEPFVVGAVALGANGRQVVVNHLLPNLAPRLGVLFVIDVGQIVLAEAGLSFLGAGVQEPDLTWGVLISEGRPYLAVAWWLTVMPGLFLAAVVLAVNMLSREMERRSQS
ncbi:ABC transporter permease [Plantactinospora mayteni]|uniref:Peptide ABC transporter permease n=1 Tax=Plantactinospora mayteni TaxID=566021 RepID=A0ABQ4ER88_9ACTN|nr:ABC transporter permease [Plantactinospora mayteni]GIG97182.1 peptide ABC transporter permease [Plantactinospora mayteni]